MRKFSESLISELEEKLKIIHSETDETVVYAIQSIKILVVALEKLKTFFLQYNFSNKAEEINFFRYIKPKLASRLIFYNEIYNIAAKKPFGAVKTIEKYYLAELKKLKIFFEENAEFCKYYRTGSHYLDNKYFIRGKHNIRLTLDSFYLQADHRFSTSHDYKVARILANDRISQFLENQINKLHNNPSSQITSKIKWTGSKTALIELIYALHTEEVFNNGTSGLKELANFFETAFNINLGQFHRVFLEIRNRKTERTKFLNILKSKLINRMDHADEN